MDLLRRNYTPMRRPRELYLELNELHVEMPLPRHSDEVPVLGDHGLM